MSLLSKFSECNDIQKLVNERHKLRENKDYSSADAVLSTLLDSYGVLCTDLRDGSSEWQYINKINDNKNVLMNKNEYATSTNDVASCQATENLSGDNSYRSGRQRRLKTKNSRLGLIKNRGKEFVSWMLQNYDKSFLQSGGGVLDIAGGKGEVSYYLSVCHDIPCTIQDPVRFHLSAAKTKHILKLIRNVVPIVACGGGAEATSCSPLDIAIQPPPFFPMHVALYDSASMPQNTSISYLHQVVSSLINSCAATSVELGWFDQLALIEHIKYQYSKSVMHASEGKPSSTEVAIIDNQMLFSIVMDIVHQSEYFFRVVHKIRHIKELFLPTRLVPISSNPPVDTRETIPDDYITDLICDASMLIGFHPDQATETIIDEAIKRNKPFAVVPCCVFPTLYPDRMLNGHQVRSFAQFMEYLKAKDNRIMQSVIENVLGPNNIVLYMHV